MVGWNVRIGKSVERSWRKVVVNIRGENELLVEVGRIVVEVEWSRNRRWWEVDWDRVS